ncbi:MAG: glycosyltransferase family 2 protein [Alphaproteobacteria bacterium]
MTKRKKLITILIPCYNEEEVINICHSEVTKIIDTLPYNFEIIYVNDGSTDKTQALLDTLQQKDKRIVVVKLSRNFGKEAAMTAGIDITRGDALIILDADLQDPPALIPDIINKWKETGADVVYGQRIMREGETWFKKFTANGFYKVINFLAHNVQLPRNTGDFRLMNRRSIDALIQLREKHRFMKGLFAWIGFNQVALQYNRAPRVAGTTKWNYHKLWHFALEGITGFSTTPLRIATLCGTFVSLFSFAFGGFIILRTIFFGAEVEGWASIMVMLTFLSGIQLLSIGVLGEYIGRIFGETKKRPLYFIDEIKKTD